MARIDLTGQRFGRLMVVRVAPNDGKMTRWICLCDCGKEHNVRTGNLRSGGVRSCGCLNAKEIKQLRATTHGLRRTSEYNAWASMRGRCLNPKNKAYHDYGGRGIKVCERWDQSFAAFLEDMGPKPTPDHSLDRFPNNNGNYEPGNCRWATSIEQNNNRRSSRVVTYRGKTQTLAEATRSLGVSYNAVLLRIQKGWDVADALEIPIINHALISRYFAWLEQTTGIPAKQLRKL